MNKETDNQHFKESSLDGGIIKVICVGGGGGNAVSHMYREGIHDVTFALCNTDRMALNDSPVPIKIQMGKDGTPGPNRPDSPIIARKNAKESEPELRQMLNDGTKMSLIIACMGGDVGTGAAPVIARISKEMGIVTVGIVTIPFKFEGVRKIDQALDGIEEMAKHVDALLVINNERLREIYPEMGVRDAFQKADETLSIAAKSIAETITFHGLVNLDINDVNSVLKDGRMTFMGIGYGEGEHAVKKAIDDAIHSPFLNGNDVFKSKKILLHVILYGGNNENGLSREEMVAIDAFTNSFGKNVMVTWGLATDLSLDKQVKVTILGTGFELKDADKLLFERHLRDEFHPGTPLEEKQIEALIDELKKPDTQHENCYFPWEHVFASMRKYPKRVCLSSKTCPDCGEKLIKLYFSSPGWTWANLCGRAGDMTVCPKCHVQKDFFLRIMN